MSSNDGYYWVRVYDFKKDQVKTDLSDDFMDLENGERLLSNFRSAIKSSHGWRENVCYYCLGSGYNGGEKDGK